MTCDDKSEGKTSVYSSSYNHDHKIFNFGHILWRKNLRFLYNNYNYVVTLPFLIFVKFCKMYIPKKMQRIEQKKKKKKN